MGDPTVPLDGETPERHDGPPEQGENDPGTPVTRAEPEEIPNDSGNAQPLGSGTPITNFDPEWSTGAAPPFPPMLAPISPHASGAVPDAASSEMKRLGDFELLRLLGVGSFGRVYLARQTSLGRLVALKVSSETGRNAPGGEAQTLARLEHANIVQVFSESFDSERCLRLLCIQYVPGTTLERVRARLLNRPRGDWSGRAILDIIDAANNDTVPLDPAALREREFLAGCSFEEAVCWLGARLAEALAHAHALGVLHRDVKPANVLLNRYGRPLLADFNVSFTVTADGAGEGAMGGTLVYMSPEHLDAFLHNGPAEAVDARADLYSLGIILFELLAGRPAFPLPGRSTTRDAVRELAAARRAGPPQFPPELRVSAPLAAVVRCCLEPDPARRFQSAAELARALDGCRDLRHVEKALPTAGPITRALTRWPFAFSFILVLLPHLLGSVVNVSYNALRIVDRLSAAQRSSFLRLVLLYNAVVYPVCVLVMIYLVLRVRRVRLQLARQGFADANDEAAARRAALRLPLWTVLLSCVGWLPGGVLFPLGIEAQGEALHADVFAHFLVSFTISGLIALTYSFLAMQYVVLRVLYPALWSDAHNLRPLARMELRGQDRRLLWAQALAVLIPLAAAVMMVSEGPGEFSHKGYRTFRVLVTALIALGMAGLGVAMAVCRLLQEVLAALRGGEREG